jgi:hypothetical protein
MINQLVELKVLLDREPRTNRRDWNKVVGKELSDLLVKEGYVKKIGITKGVKWFWNAENPSYEMVNTLTQSLTPQEEPNFLEIFNDTDETTFVDVLRSRKISLSIGNGVKIFFGDDSMIVRRGEKEMIVKTPGEFSNLLNFLT